MNDNTTDTAGRRSFLTTAGALGAAAALPLITLPRYARAAEFNLKYGSELPLSHPQVVRIKEATDNIRKETGGRVDIEVFAAGALGSITDMISQTRSGAIQMLSVAMANMTTFDPKASLTIPYAFKDYNAVWAAMDGELGAYSRRVISRFGFHVFDNMWDHGFRQMTTRTKAINSPDDLKGFKIRVAVVPMYVSLFKALGAAPTAINFSELYSALQTRVVDGQENSLALIDSARFYEVQPHLGRLCHRLQRCRLEEAARQPAGHGEEAFPRGHAEPAAGHGGSLRHPAGPAHGQGHEVQSGRFGAVSQCVEQRRLLQGVERKVRPRSLGRAREVLRQPRLKNKGIPC